MLEVLNDVEKAIDFAFSEGKFVLDFYDYLKIKEAKKIDAENFLNSSTAKNVQEIVNDLDIYLLGAKEDDGKFMREAYGFLSKPEARKIRNYLIAIIEDSEKYIYDKRRGRRKKTETK
jgi:hypothetical protein